MPNITTAPELVNALSATAPEYTKAEYQDFLRVLRSTIKNQLLQGNEVSITGLGAFHLKKNPDRVASFTGAPVQYKGNTTLKFTISQTLAADVKEAVTQK